MLTRLQYLWQSVSACAAAMNGWLCRHSFSAGDRVAFYDMLAFLLDNEKPLRVALSSMHAVATDTDRRSPPAAVLLTDCIQALDEGESIEVALLDWVPVHEATLIGSGVLGGNIAEALRRASRIVQGKSAMTSALTGAVTYPCFLLFLVVLMMNLVCNKFIPQLAKLVPREKWAGSLHWLAWISESVVHHGAFIIVCSLALMVLLYWSLDNWSGRKRADLLPPWSVYRAVHGVYFLLNISSLLRVNIQVMQAVRMLSETASPWLEKRLEATLRYMNQGEHLGRALKSTGYHFPSRECVNQMMLLTEGAGAENILERYADRWLDITIRQVKKKSMYLTGLCFSLVFSYLLLLLLATKDLNHLVNQLG